MSLLCSLSVAEASNIPGEHDILDYNAYSTLSDMFKKHSLGNDEDQLEILLKIHELKNKNKKLINKFEKNVKENRKLLQEKESVINALKKDKTIKKDPFFETYLELNSYLNTYLASLNDNTEIADRLSKEYNSVGLDPYLFGSMMMQNNYAFINKLLPYINDYRKNPETLEKLLELVLVQRFEFLISKKDPKAFLKSHKREDFFNNAYYVLPTDSDSYDTLNLKSRYCVDILIDQYQFYNRMVLFLLKGVDMKSLKNTTKTLLRASVSLYNRIAEHQDDLGHPDEALYSSSTDSSVKRDCDFYSYYVDKTEKKLIESYSSFHKEKTSIFLTPYERDMIQNCYSGMPDLPYPSFLKKETASLRSSPNSDIPTPEKTNPNETQSWLPGGIQKSTISDDSKHKSQKQRSWKKSKAIPALINSIHQQQDLHPQQDDGTKPEAKLTLCMDSKKDLRTQQKMKVELISSETNKKGAFKKNIKASLSKDHMPKKQEMITPFSSLKTKHKNILEDIFDNQKLSDVTFQKFTTLWESLGGVIPKKNGGGSHRTLLFNNKVVGGTYVPHGGHAYGKRSIKSLRDAFEKIGYTG